MGRPDLLNTRTPEDEKLIAELKAYWNELKEALESMDEARIRAFHAKYFPGRAMPEGEMFWGAVHKMITGFKDIKLETRKASKAWLTKRGFRSYDDGDL